MDGKICIEQYMYDAYKRTEERVNQLRRLLDAGEATEKIICLIFDWEMPKREQIPTIPISTTPAIVPPPPKPMTSKKHEMMKKVKELHKEGLNGAQIAKKTGLSETTISTYKKEMGLVGETSMTLIEGAHGGQMQ